MRNEYECRYLFEDKSNNIDVNIKDLTYRELSARFRVSTNNTEKEAILYELKIREVDVMQARRKTYFGGNYPMTLIQPQTD